ncbi:MAG: type transport system ATP-binding protein [Actinomycetota bacterium]|nr:type transport system ATP-binding protein [Actinomycetota bacterium]
MSRCARAIGRVLLASTLVGALAACSSSAKSSAPAAPSSTTAPGSEPTTTTPAKCTPPAIAKPVVRKVAGVASDWDLSSFDGTKIRLHWFPAPGTSAAHREPTILMGPGWGQPGDTNTSAGNASGAGVIGATTIASLWKAGYNVLTWDPRGFGQSTGTVEVDSAQFEARDVTKLIDWVATQPNATLDQRGDPRLGMVGGSYGGGIQLVTAAIDCRVDAIVPVIAWHSLTTSLAKADTPKNGWASILIAATNGRSVDPHIPHAYKSSITSGSISEADRTWFAQRGPGDLVGRVNIPTLIVQGTIDNLFTLDEGIQNYRILRDRGVPTAMMWFCGGHGVCLTNPGDPTRVQTALIKWLDRYVKGNTKVDTGPRFDFVDQNGTRYTAGDYPVAAGAPVTAQGRGILRLIPDGGSGPAHPPANSSDVLAGIAGSITPARATNAVEMNVGFKSAAVVVGAPELKLSYHGTVASGVSPTRVFAQLVDNASGTVIGNQITPIEVTLDGQEHSVTVPLEVIAFTAKAGANITLQIVATTTAYAKPRLGGTVVFGAIRLSLPTAADLHPLG